MLFLPLRSFWMLSNNVTRLSAEEDIRKLSVTAGAASEKGFKQTLDALQSEMGEVFKRSEREEHLKGLSKLRQLMTKMKLSS